MRGTDAEQHAHKEGTAEYNERRENRRKWARRTALLVFILGFGFFARSCLVEVSKTTVFGAAKARDAIEQTARELREPRQESSPPPPIADVPSRTILVEVPVGELRTYKTRDYLEGAQFRVGWPDVEQGKLAAFEDGNDVATCTDFPGNPTTCYVDFEDSITFKNIGKEALRFYLTFTRLR